MIELDKQLGVVRAKTKGSFTMQELDKSMEELKKLFLNMDKKLLLADVRENDRVMATKEERVRMRELSKDLTWDKAAVVGADTLVRMSAKIVLAAIGLSKTTRFFKTEDEALRWLKEKP